MTKERAFHPVVIIGAGRSGTNILRDTLVQLPGYGTWPCDEINYIWRHGNMRQPTDEFDPSDATDSVRRFVRGRFAAIANSLDAATVVEKTCANSLRVGFVDAILPEARYIFIVRDGRDVVSSAMKRWTAPLDIPYLLRKARFVPPVDIPYYASRYVGNRIHRIMSGEKRLAFWGPRFHGMQEMLANSTLAEVCAAQWVRCVERSESDFQTIDASGRLCRVQYEDLVLSPGAEIQRIVRFLGVEMSQSQAEQMGRNLSRDSIGKWQKDMATRDLDRIQPLLLSVLRRYGYE